MATVESEKKIVLDERLIANAPYNSRGEMTARFLALSSSDSAAQAKDAALPVLSKETND